MKDLYSAESQLIKALPKMAEAASNTELKKAFQNHVAQTRSHAVRLQKALNLLGETARGKTCMAMKGLVDEGSDAIKSEAPEAVRDAHLIGAAQRVEHYEIAAYGCARAFAVKLAHHEIADLLQMTLTEEGDANGKLTEIAETVNEDAYAAADIIS